MESSSLPILDDDDTKSRRTQKGRVFQCTGYPDCSMSFTRLEHLARHKRKHTGERPFTCPHCLKNFSRLDNLRQHKQTVHAYEVYLVDKKLPTAPQPTSTQHHSIPIHHPSSANYTSYPQIHPPPQHFIVSAGMHHQIQPRPLQPTHIIAHNPPPQGAYFMVENLQPATPSLSVFLANSLPYTPVLTSPLTSYGGVSKPFTQNGGSTLLKPTASTGNSTSNHKRRPRPLHLEQLAYVPGLQLIYLRPQLRLAPLGQLGSNNSLYNGPKLALLSRTMILPLLPLFHQLFKQTINIDSSANSPALRETIVPAKPKEQSHSPSTGSNSPTSVVSLNHPDGVSVSPIEKLSTNTTTIDGKTELKSTKPSMEIPNATPGAFRRDWLRGVLNDDNGSAPPKPHTLLKKPTIDLLLLPY